MEKQLSPKELDKIRKRAISKCNSYGFTPMMKSPYGDIVNPAYSTCLQKEYNDAVKASGQGRLNEWYQKTDAFVKSQGGLSGIFSTISSLSDKYKEGYEKGLQGRSDVFGMGYDPNVAPQSMTAPDKDRGNIGLWIGIVLVLITLIIFSVIYFRKK